MAQIVWSDKALSDLVEIGDFISVDSERFAELTINKLFAKPEVLIDYPKLGRVVQELQQENIRELIEGNYRIVYELTGDTILILTVHHAARRLR